MFAKLYSKLVHILHVSKAPTSGLIFSNQTEIIYNLLMLYTLMSSFTDSEP